MRSTRDVARNDILAYPLLIKVSKRGNPECFQRKQHRKNDGEQERRHDRQRKEYRKDRKYGRCDATYHLRQFKVWIAVELFGFGLQAGFVFKKALNEEGCLLLFFGSRRSSPNHLSQVLDGSQYALVDHRSFFYLYYFLGRFDLRCSSSAHLMPFAILHAIWRAYREFCFLT